MTEDSFHPTRWTLVLRSHGEGAEARAALSELCDAYYAPVVAFLRRSERQGDDEARERAHDFFAKVLSGGLGLPDPERGRFRNYLLGALKHFLFNRREAGLTRKRGGGVEHLPLVPKPDGRPDLPLPGITDDILAFDREWALTLIARALATLEAEHEEKAAHFSILKPWLDGGAAMSQAEAARALGMTENAVKVAIHRLRVRFRELIRAEVAATVSDPQEVADELRHLIAVASAG